MMMKREDEEKVTTEWKNFALILSKKDEEEAILYS